ncbi:metallophosphoesterase family protein [Methylocella tundrae]|uniref:Metallophosphatase n=1 Tax=Methylocella tundrae TaxID=227605 RepID=A0A4U8Z565_METTU|nr:metallophosphoesterase [Methylocella tundrae]WPP04321.1 metallophosphoesterase [Methylocella tundrae]VFU10654.1 Metallophosphatase [Methylocella tundrae]
MATVQFRLAHLTDPHLGPLPRPRRRELLGKRVTGYLNWTRGRSLVHDMATLSHIVADIRAQNPDHVAMTGDIANIGLPAEFQLARKWLETLGPPDDVSFVPGNHDAYVRGSLPDLARVFAPWTKGENEPDGRFPYLRVRGKVALIGLSSAVPTPFFIASGRLGRRQIELAEKLLAEAAGRDLVRVVMLHHSPRTDAASLARGLTDARDFEEMIGRTGAELILHGHNHRLSVSHIEGPKRRAPVVGAPSASIARPASRHRAGYNLFEITGSLRDYEIKGFARGLLPGTTTIGDLGPIPLGLSSPRGVRSRFRKVQG